MHEYSVVQSLMTQCEEHAAANNAAKVTKIVVKIGVMSGIEPYLLETAFNTFKEGTVCEGGEFVMNIQPLKIECQECKTVSDLEKIEYCCPKCQSIDVKVIDGEDMFLMSLEMQ
ncbi:hydrogenase/urease nickel incorporation protein HypA [Sulfurimonas sp. HSL-1716]|uniref:hydrogenase/urease nickel incorporation protein HypA n=1 Tax=Hydrocurvibacter sulfurireducens TaxID=3131937 RepID=UPI0031F8F11F